MEEKEFQQKLKEATDEFGRKTIYNILKNDIQYQLNISRMEEAEKKYFEILPTLSDEQRQIIEQFIDSKDSINTELNSVSYLAGIKDMVEITHYLNLTSK